MSRSGYYEFDDDNSNWDSIRWSGAVKSAIRGKRGQDFLKALLEALDAMPVKELIAGELEKDGQVCALGALGKARGLDMSGLDPEDAGPVADTFGISKALAREIVFVNDDDFGFQSMESSKRFEAMRKWVVENIKPE